MAIDREKEARLWEAWPGLPGRLGGVVPAGGAGDCEADGAASGAGGDDLF